MHESGVICDIQIDFKLEHTTVCNRAEKQTYPPLLSRHMCLIWHKYVHVVYEGNSFLYHLSVFHAPSHLQ